VAPPPVPLQIEVGHIYEGQDAEKEWHLLNVTNKTDDGFYIANVANGNFTVYEGKTLTNETFNNTWVQVRYDYLRATPAPPVEFVPTPTPVFYAPDPLKLNQTDGSILNGTGKMTFHKTLPVPEPAPEEPAPAAAEPAAAAAELLSAKSVVQHEIMINEPGEAELLSSKRVVKRIRTDAGHEHERELHPS